MKADNLRPLRHHADIVAYAIRILASVPNLPEAFDYRLDKARKQLASLAYELAHEPAPVSPYRAEIEAIQQAVTALEGIEAGPTPVVGSIRLVRDILNRAARDLNERYTDWGDHETTPF